MRDYRIDLLRIIAVLAVVGIHCFAGKGEACNIVNGFCRFSVPVFVMISAICCEKSAQEAVTTGGLVRFYRRRFMRVAIPLLAFSFLYMGEDVFAGASIREVLENFILGKPSYHLWFGFMLLGVYVFMPFLWLLADQINKLVLISVCTFVILMTWSVGYGLYSILPFTAYALIGIIVQRFLLRLQISRTGVRWITGLSALTVYVIAACCAGAIGEHRAWTYTSIYSLSGSIAVLIVVMLLPKEINVIFVRPLALLASLTFGVYLFHVIAIRGILRMLPRLLAAEFCSATILWFGVVALSFGVTFVASRNTILSSVFGVR